MGVNVYDATLSAMEAACVFYAGDATLPAPVAPGLVRNCSHVASSASLSLIGRAPFTDTSGYSRHVQQYGGVRGDATGTNFDGQDDYVTIATFPYAADKSFSISLWMAKRTITGNNYEYLYAHQYSNNRSTWESHPYMIIMFAAESTGAGGSSVDGSVIRYEIQDASANHAIFDYSVHRAGDFDAITNVWLHVVLTVTSTSLKTYVDGQLVRDPEYGHYTGIPASSNAANPTPSRLSPALSGQLDLRTDIYIGSRADLDPQRFFRGRLALVNVYDATLSAMEAACVFYAGDAALPAPVAPGLVRNCSHVASSASLSLIGRAPFTDTSGYSRHVQQYGGVRGDATGTNFDGQDDYVTIATFPYAADKSFSISLWMAKRTITGNNYEYLYAHQYSNNRSTW